MTARRRITARSAAAAVAMIAASLRVVMPVPAEAAESPGGVIELDETVISGNQELPKVLYIVPWRQPEGLPEIELSADLAEEALFRPLYPPAHRRELQYRTAAEATD